MIVTSLKTMEEIRQGTLLTWPSQLNFESWGVAWGGRGYGAGDTFLAGLVCEYLKSQDIKKSIEFSKLMPLKSIKVRFLT